jgi:hypothetical protein
MGELQAALIGGLVGGLLGAIVGGIVSFVTQSREHAARRSEQAEAQRHALAMAREERIQARRQHAYEEIVQFSYWLVDWVNRTKPIMTPAPAPPAPLPDGELQRLNTITALHASTEVRRLTEAMSERLSEFRIAAEVLDDMEKRRPHSDESNNAWRDVSGTRGAFGEAAVALRQQASSELQLD